MQKHSPPLISAQVLLGSNGSSHTKEVLHVFKEAGFDVGQIVTNSFSITASPEVFERFFDVNIEVTPAGKVTVMQRDGSSSLNLPTAALPEHLRRRIQAIFFSKPPDFGPNMF
jgi:hypothetical protein